jgi:hypothetical protein
MSTALQPIAQRNDITRLLQNILRFVWLTDESPYVIDFMNHVRRHKMDTRNRLGDAMRDTSMYIEKKRKDVGITNIAPKIIVHKNPEGTALDPEDINDMQDFTRDNPSSIVLYVVCGEMVKHPDESFSDMKNRYKKTDPAMYAMYSRDDFVMQVVYQWLQCSHMSPIMWSGDKFRDTHKYSEMQPFHVYLVIAGYMYQFVFRYGSLRFDVINKLAVWLQTHSNT